MGMLSQFEFTGYGSVTDLHRLTEALRVRFFQLLGFVCSNQALAETHLVACIWPKNRSG